MDMPLLRPDQFMVMFPCFAVMSQSCIGGVVQPLDHGQGIAAIILTDEDLLTEFRIKTNSLGPTIRFEFHQQLYMYLRSLPNEVTHVLFDPSSGKPKLILRTDLIRQLANR